MHGLVQTLIFLLQFVSCAYAFKVEGEITFSPPPDSLPTDTSIVLKIEDTSLYDLHALELARTTINVSTENYNNNKNKTISFSINVTKRASHPKLIQVYVLSAVVNVGWVPHGGKWVQFGDYLTDGGYELVVTSDRVYTQNITVVKYS